MKRVAVLTSGGDAPGMNAAFIEQQRERYGLDLRITRLGHVQRGGAPGVYGRILATRLGAAAIDFLKAGCSSVLVGLWGSEVSATPLAECASRTASVSPHLLASASALKT